MIAGGLLVTPFINATSDPNSSAVGIAMGKGTFASYTMSQRAFNALNAMSVVGLGMGAPGTTYTNKGTTGMVVLTGVGLKIAGKFVNPMMSGSFVKL